MNSCCPFLISSGLRSRVCWASDQTWPVESRMAKVSPRWTIVPPPPIVFEANSDARSREPQKLTTEELIEQVKRDFAATELAPDDEQEQ